MAAIEVKNLIKKYKKSKENAVDNISFKVNEGDFFAFLGPNGAGKTTTISILTTTLGKTSGEVKIAGLDIDKGSSKIRSQIGIIFQNPSLDLNLTGEQNIRFHSILYGLFPFSPFYSLMDKEYKNRVNELASLIGLEKDIFKPVKEFSGGMKRKLEIIRSLMHKPKILFLDEPTVGLDPESRRNVWDYIQNIRKTTGVTVFLTTHYLEEVEDADQICIINKGKIVADGSPEQIKSKITSEYILMRSEDSDKLKLEDEIKRMGIKYQKTGEYFKVYVDNETNVQDIINGIKTHLTFLDIKRISLEDAYIKIIKEELNI